MRANPVVPNLPDDRAENLGLADILDPASMRPIDPVTEAITADVAPARSLLRADSDRSCYR